MTAHANRPDEPIGTCRYKGRDYAILWSGSTKYGRRLKLAFRDDMDQTFWIDADRAESVELFDPPPAENSSPRRSSRRRPPDDGPRRRSTPPADAAPRVDESESEPPEFGDDCYCASCGQLLPQQF